MIFVLLMPHTLNRDMYVCKHKHTGVYQLESVPPPPPPQFFFSHSSPSKASKVTRTYGFKGEVKLVPPHLRCLFLVGTAASKSLRNQVSDTSLQRGSFWTKVSNIFREFT